MSLFHVCIYSFDLMLHMLPEAHKTRGLQSTMRVLVHFCVTGNLFYECKIGGIIQKVVFLLKLKQNRHIDLIMHEAKLLNNLFMKTFYRELGQH